MAIDYKDAYSTRFRLRRAVQGRKFLRVGIPWVVVEREAKKRNVDIDTFLETHEVECLYNNFDGVHYQFVPKEEE